MAYPHDQPSSSQTSSPTSSTNSRPDQSFSFVPPSNDWFGVANSSSRLDRLADDYGLDTSASFSSSSAKNAMRYLRSLEQTSPDMLARNERLLLSTSRGEEDDNLRGRRLHPRKDVSRSWGMSDPEDEMMTQDVAPSPTAGTSSVISASASTNPNSPETLYWNPHHSYHHDTQPPIPPQPPQSYQEQYHPQHYEYQQYQQYESTAYYSTTENYQQAQSSPPIPVMNAHAHTYGSYAPSHPHAHAQAHEHASRTNQYHQYANQYESPEERAGRAYYATALGQPWN